MIKVVYGLREEDSTEIRYVGSTKSFPTRIHLHFGKREMTLRSESEKTAWIKDALSRNKRIVADIIEECNPSVASGREQFWIEHYRSLGYRLTNIRKAKRTVLDLKAMSKEKYLKSKAKKSTQTT